MELLSDHRHRPTLKALIQDAVAVVEPNETEIARDLIDPLLDRIERGDQIEPRFDDRPGGFGGVELAVWAITPLVLHALAKLIRELGENWAEKLAPRTPADRAGGRRQGELFVLSVEDAAVVLRVPVPDDLSYDLPELVHAVHEAVWRHINRSIVAETPIRHRPRLREFALGIEPDGDGGLRSRVLPSSGGSAPTPFQPPFELDDLPWVLRRLELRVRGPGRNLSPAATGAAQIDPEGFGADLFDALIAGGVRDAYERGSGGARRRGEGLRLRLVLDPEQASLLACPWELLFDRRRRRFLAHDLETPIVRQLETGVPSEPRLDPVDPPLRLLLASAEPTNASSVGAAEEIQRLSEALKTHPTLAPTSLVDATYSSLRRALREVSPHIVHYIGHGEIDETTNTGQLLLCDEQGEMDPVSGAELANHLSGAPELRLVVLNGCDTAVLPRRRGVDAFSSTAGALILEGLPAVVAMQFPISNAAAVLFAQGFYEALAAGDPVEAALVEGRHAILANDRQSGGFEWVTPVLYLRVQDGDLFGFNDGAGPR